MNSEEFAAALRDELVPIEDWSGAGKEYYIHIAINRKHLSAEIAKALSTMVCFLSDIFIGYQVCFAEGPNVYVDLHMKGPK